MGKGNGTKKGRSGATYQHKIDRIRKWHAHMVANRQEKDGIGNVKKELKPIEFFIDKVKGPTKA